MYRFLSAHDLPNNNFPNRKYADYLTYKMLITMYLKNILMTLKSKGT